MLQTEFGHHKTVYARWGGHIKQKCTYFFHLGFEYTTTSTAVILQPYKFAMI